MKLYVKYYLARFREKIQGVEFIKPFAEDPSYGEDYYPSRSSGGKPLRELLRKMPISKTDSIVDIGCGKGRAINEFRHFPFRKIDGIELLGNVSKVAEYNFKRLKERRVNIYNANATSFEKYHQYTYYYLYNPFSERILEEVLRLIDSSLVTHPRSIFIIYDNPTGHKMLEKH
ncbi:MAG: class I SAM-dependent methyltransferase [Bacteroidetes bacterium]|nr:class I SAM-dependent methyltransferase [Bacteroidota bacterium]